MNAENVLSINFLGDNVIAKRYDVDQIDLYKFTLQWSQSNGSRPHGLRSLKSFFIDNVL